MLTESLFFFKINYFFFNNLVRATANIRFPSGSSFTPGNDIVIECDVTGYPEPQVKWYKDEVEIFQSERVHIVSRSDDNQIIISSATPEDSGSYKCEAHNYHSTAHHTESIHIQSKA